MSEIKEQKMKQLNDMQLLQYKEELVTTNLKREVHGRRPDYQGEIRRNRAKDTCEVQQPRCGGKIAEIEAETVRISDEIRANCDEEIQLINAEKDALQVKLDAVTGEICARAEGTAATKLEKYRMYKLEMKNLDKLGALSKNKKVAISGDTSNSLLSEMLVANHNKSVMFNLDGLIKSNEEEARGEEETMVVN